MSDQPGPEPVPVERLRFDLPPEPGTPGQERAHRKERLAEALRLLARLGWEDGVAGHITARDPEFPDCYWVNPFGTAFGGLTPADLLLVDGEGRVLQGGRRVNELAFAVHAAVHRARPEVVSVVRVPAPYGRALAALGELLAPITPEACAFYEDHALLDEFAVAEDPARIGRALGPYKALILRNRGLLTVGGSVDAAVWWSIAAERAAQVQLIARAAGKPVPIDHRAAVATRERFGTDLAAWVSYQPLRRQPGPAGGVNIMNG
ncbi:class II aldolase/adducin family protein [Streptomyces venezuelae]|uniref:Class II aldolase/adducin family protein n=1 Tax=Streptomyces venezuelae TaxID=54571 RepID=A0A5P2D6A4_STRVZ|nr:class II aldolase/adducin family protein [Streptomyces venezuelae]QES49727.1 class II aldolase/adducin family protein [Streptomyces venezuelae]